MSPFVRRASIRHTDRVLARSVLLLLLAVYLGTAPGRLVGVRARYEFGLSRSLTSAQEPRNGERLTPPDRSSAPAPAVALVGLPFLLAGDLLSLAVAEPAQGAAFGAPSGSAPARLFPQMLFGLAGALFTALSGWLVLLTARRLGAERVGAFVAALAYGLASHAWVNGREGLGIALGSFGLLAGFHLLVRAREELDRLRVPRSREFLGLGCGLALAILSEPMLLPACLYLSLLSQLILTRGWRRMSASKWASLQGIRRTSACLWIPVLASLAALLALAASGSGSLVQGLFPTPPRAPREWLGGALALLFSPGEGLCFFAPWVLIALLARDSQRGRRERLGTSTTVVVFLTCLLQGAAFDLPHLRSAYGPAILLPALPFLALGLALALSKSEDNLRRVLAAGALLLGLLIQLPGALIDSDTQEDLASQAFSVSDPERASAAGQAADSPPAGTLARASGQGVRAGAGAGAGEGSAAGRAPRSWRAGTLWNWRFAAPWARWRTLRTLVAVGGEEVAVQEIFFVDHPARLRLSRSDGWGLGHLAWVELERRLGISPWWGGILAGLFLIVGLVFAILGLDSTAA